MSGKLCTSFCSGDFLSYFRVVSSKSILGVSIISSVFFLGVSSISYATNGYIMHGYGKNKGMGGAGMANPQDALIGASNPAGAVWVGDRIDVSGELFKPNRGYEISAPGKSTFDSNSSFNLTNAGDAFGAANQSYRIDSTKNAMETDIGFLIPSMGFVKQLPHGNAIGLSVYGAGMGTEYDRKDVPDWIVDTQAGPVNLTETQGITGTFMDGSTGVDLLLIMANLHFASKITDDLSVGVGLVGAAQRFKAKGLGAFQAISQGNIKSGEGEWAFGMGFTTGFQWNVNDQLSVAASYYSKIKLTYDKYDGLFADEGDFSVAPMTNIGVTYKPNRTSALSFDVQWIQYSEIPAPGNKFNALFRDPTAENPLPIVPLGNKDGAGFGFDDSIVYKMGYQFQIASLPKYTWRVGYAYQDQIIPSDGTLFPMLAPATITQHYTAGLTHDFSKDIELNMNFLYAPKEKVKGKGISEGVDIWLEEYGIELGLGYKY